MNAICSALTAYPFTASSLLFTIHKTFLFDCGYFSVQCSYKWYSAFGIRIINNNNNRLKSLIVLYSSIPSWCWQCNTANRLMHWNPLGLLPFAFSTHNSLFVFRFTNRKLDSRQFFFAFKLNQIQLLSSVDVYLYYSHSLFRLQCHSFSRCRFSASFDISSDI